MKWDGAEKMWRVWRSMAWTGDCGGRRVAEKPFTESTDRFPRGCVRGIRI